MSELSEPTIAQKLKNVIATIQCLYFKTFCFICLSTSNYIYIKKIAVIQLKMILTTTSLSFNFVVYIVLEYQNLFSKYITSSVLK